MYWTAKEKDKQKQIAGRKEVLFYLFNNRNVIKQKKSWKTHNVNKNIEIMSSNNVIFGIYYNTTFYENIYIIELGMKSTFNPLETNNLKKWSCYFLAIKPTRMHKSWVSKNNCNLVSERNLCSQIAYGFRCVVSISGF